MTASQGTGNAVFADLVKFLRCCVYCIAVVLGVAAIYLISDLEDLVHNIDQSVTNGQNIIAKSDALLSEAQLRLMDTSKNLNALLLQASLTADNIRRASEAQQEYQNHLEAILSNSDQILKDVHTTILHGDGELSATSQAAQRNIQDLDVLETSTAQAVQANSAELTGVLKDAQASLENLNKLANSDETKYLLVQAMSASSALAGASANIERASGDIGDWVHRETKPARGIVKVLGYASIPVRWFLK